MRSKVASVGAAYCNAIDKSGVSSVVLTTRPKNKNIPVTSWTNLISALSSDGESLGFSVY